MGNVVIVSIRKYRKTVNFMSGRNSLHATFYSFKQFQDNLIAKR